MLVYGHHPLLAAQTRTSESSRTLLFAPYNTIYFLSKFCCFSPRNVSRIRPPIFRPGSLAPWILAMTSDFSLPAPIQSVLNTAASVEWLNLTQRRRQVSLQNASWLTLSFSSKLCSGIEGPVSSEPSITPLRRSSTPFPRSCHFSYTGCLAVPGSRQAFSCLILFFFFFSRLFFF